MKGVGLKGGRLGPIPDICFFEGWNIFVVLMNHSIFYFGSSLSLFHHFVPFRRLIPGLTISFIIPFGIIIIFPIGPTVTNSVWRKSFTTGSIDFSLNLCLCVSARPPIPSSPTNWRTTVTVQQDCISSIRFTHY